METGAGCVRTEGGAGRGREAWCVHFGCQVLLIHGAVTVTAARHQHLVVCVCVHPKLALRKLALSLGVDRLVGNGSERVEARTKVANPVVNRQGFLLQVDCVTVARSTHLQVRASGAQRIRLGPAQNAERTGICDENRRWEHRGTGWGAKVTGTRRRRAGTTVKSRGRDHRPSVPCSIPAEPRRPLCGTNHPTMPAFCVTGSRAKFGRRPGIAEGAGVGTAHAEGPISCMRGREARACTQGSPKPNQFACGIPAAQAVALFLRRFTDRHILGGLRQLELPIASKLGSPNFCPPFKTWVTQVLSDAERAWRAQNFWERC